MKKFLTILLACFMLGVGLVGCGQTGEEVKSAFSGAVAEFQKDVKAIEETIEMDGKAALEILEEGEKTVKYKFTVAEEAVATEVSELEKKAVSMEEQIMSHLKALEDKGVAEAEAVVQFVDKEGKELYSKIFK